MRPHNGEWFKSSFSNANQGCVEVKLTCDQVQVRDSTDPDGPQLVFDRVSWEAFLRGASNGEFEMPARLG
jgi:Domain of unknown function (DUF397)